MVIRNQLCIEAVEAGKIDEILQCKIECGPVLNLEVKAIIKSPFVTLDCGRIDFNIVEVGKTLTKPVTVINRNPVESSWSAQTIPEIRHGSRLALAKLSKK